MVFRISSHLFIQKIAVPHCARGSKLCKKCEEAGNNLVVCLVQVYSEHGNMARPIDKFPIAGTDAFCEFDVVRRFKDEVEAQIYAREHPEVQFLCKE